MKKRKQQTHKKDNSMLKWIKTEQNAIIDKVRGNEKKYHQTNKKIREHPNKKDNSMFLWYGRCAHPRATANKQFYTIRSNRDQCHFPETTCSKWDNPTFDSNTILPELSSYSLGCKPQCSQNSMVNMTP